MQVDPVSRSLLHVDFQRISMTEKVTLAVPITLTGIPEGVRTGGGILEHLLREVEIRCLPSAIPEAISVDVTPLLIGHSIHVSDLTTPEVEILTEGERAIATVVPPTAYEEPQPGAVPLAEEAKEPELIKKERKEEEEETETPAPKEAKEEKKEKAKG
jgi:large subunit ribosomal protein L25